MKANMGNSVLVKSHNETQQVSVTDLSELPDHNAPGRVADNHITLL